MTRLRPLFGIALGWAALWLAFWTIVGVVIGVVDPDSIDPGEGWMVVFVLGPMGLFSGVAFGLLLSVGARGTAHTELPVIGVAARGFLACAIVQTAYLGHGDVGLVANIKMALLFSAIGAVITLVWLVLARKWPYRGARAVSADVRAGPSSESSTAERRDTGTT